MTGTENVTVTNTVTEIDKDKKIEELEARVSRLEKIERDRKIRRIIGICVTVFFYLLIFIAMYKLFSYLKPYLEQVNQIRDITGGSGYNFDLNGFDFSSLFN